MTAQASAVNVTGGGVVVATPCTYRGLSIADTSGLANTVKVFDNASAASGTVIAVVALAADGSASEVVPDGVRAERGLFLESTGAIVGSIRIG